MANLNLYYPTDTVALDLVLALWSELTVAWRPQFAHAPLDLPMPVGNAQVSLYERLQGNSEYAYSFDVICRLVARCRDTTQAQPIMFEDENNSKWLRKISYPNGLETKDLTRRTVNCVELTSEAKAYWKNLSPEARERAITRAETILYADIESGGEIVSVLPQEALPTVSITDQEISTASGSRTDRSALLRQLVDEIQQEPFHPHYRKQKLDRPVVFGWDARLRTYFWPRPSVDYTTTCRQVQSMLDNAKELATALQDGLEWNTEQQAAAIDLANTIFAWGGVPQDPKTVTTENVRQVFIDALGNNNRSAAPMNSGWTKVAAFATAHLEQAEPTLPQAIWDSRVATAVTSRLDRLITAAGGGEPSTLFPGIGTVPGQGGTRPRALMLKWPVGYKKWDAQVKGSALIRDIRDLLNGAPGYPRMPLPDGSQGKWTTRGVEMVLFMDGY